MPYDPEVLNIAAEQGNETNENNLLLSRGAEEYKSQEPPDNVASVQSTISNRSTISNIGNNNNENNSLFYIFQQLVLNNQEFSKENFQVYLEFKLNTFFINYIFHDSRVTKGSIDIIINNSETLCKDIISDIINFMQLLDNKNVINHFNHLCLEIIHSEFHISRQNFDLTDPKFNDVKEKIVNYFGKNFKKSRLFKNFFKNIDNNPLFLFNKIQSLDMDYLKMFYKLDDVTSLSNLKINDNIDFTSEYLKRYLLTKNKFEKLKQLIDLSNETERPERPDLDLRTSTNTRKISKLKRTVFDRRQPSTESGNDASNDGNTVGAVRGSMGSENGNNASSMRSSIGSRNSMSSVTNGQPPNSQSPEPPNFLDDPTYQAPSSITNDPSSTNGLPEGNNLTEL